MNAYRKHTNKGLRELKLAQTYAEDGAVASAADLAKIAAKSFERAVKAKEILLGSINKEAAGK